jgi:signal transduction histidine kinase
LAVEALDGEALREELDRLQLEVEELRASRERIVLASDAERRGIERELHDGPQQQLVAHSVTLQLARDLLETDPAAAKALLDELALEVQRAVDATAMLAQRIYPPLLEAGGLAAALRAAAVRTVVRARIEVSGSSDCPPAVAGAVYFCCLDALELAGEGAPAAIQVRRIRGELLFDVAVDRLPATATFDAALDRVEALGGRVEVDASTEHGVRISGALPLAL